MGKRAIKNQYLKSKFKIQNFLVSSRGFISDNIKWEFNGQQVKIRVNIYAYIFFDING